MDRTTVLQQIQRDFPADDIRVDDMYLYVGDRYRSFINADFEELVHSRASGNRGRNYVVFLSMFLYTRFRLLPARGTLSYELITEIETAKAQHFHARLQRFGNGVGYYEYFDGNRWRVRAIPFADPDYRVPIPIAPPDAPTDHRQPRDEDDLEELEAVIESLPSGPPA
jgi:hypothetical protein